jgi:hypothetical protein
MLLKQKPDYSSLKVFGSACWPNLRSYNSRKLAFKCTQCVFIGYSAIHKGYKCLEPKTGRVYISRDVVFDEQIFPFEDLHENAGAKLRQEISLLSPDLMPSYNMFQGDQNSVPEGGEEEIHVQVLSGAPSNSVVDSIPIISTKIQEDLRTQPAPMMRDSASIGYALTAMWDSPMMETRDSLATSSHAPRTAQGHVPSRSVGTPVEEGSSVRQYPTDGSVVHQNQEVIVQPRGVKTRSKFEISKPKIYTDGIV